MMKTLAGQIRGISPLVSNEVPSVGFWGTWGASF